ncbi:MAG TPA: hypothetical protein VEB22_05800 [Phycisphaerales bacterium]|nr:hypothetical protein [Phycisphaerales bacterium]
MSTWRHTLAVAQRRAAAGAAVTAAAAVLPIAAGTALAWAAVAAALEREVHWPVVGGAVAAATLGAAIVGWLRRPSALAVASALDRHAGNHSAIATALQLSTKPQPTLLEARAIADADSAGADPRGAFPWQLRRPAVLSAAAAAMLTAAAFIPDGWPVAAAHLVGLDSGRALAPREEVQRALADATAAEELIKAVQQPAAASTPEGAESTSRADPFAELKEQLQNGNVSPKETTQQAATAIERAADKMERGAAEAQRAHDLLRDRLAQGSKEATTPAGGEASSELTRALREGDLERAAAEAERLAGAAEKLSPDARAKLAQELKQVADDLGKTSEPKPAAPTPADAVKPDQPSPRPNPSAPDEPKAADPQRPSTAEADRQARDLAEKLDRAAEELKSSPEAQPNQQTTPSEAQSSSPDPKPQGTDQSKPADQQQDGRSSEQPKPQPTPRDPTEPSPPKGEAAGQAEKAKPSPREQAQPREQSTPGDKPGDRRQSAEKPGEPAQPKAGDKQENSPPGPQASKPGNQPSPGDQSGSKPQSEPSSKPPAGANPGQTAEKNESTSSSQKQPVSGPGTPKPDTAPRSNNDPQGEPIGAQPSEKAPSAAPYPEPDTQPEPGAKPGEARPGDKLPPLEQLREQLKKLADQPRNAKRDRQDAQKLREQAQKIWENATPEQRKEMEKLARELAESRSKDDRHPSGSTPPGKETAPQHEPQQARGGAGEGNGRAGGPGDAPPSARPRAGDPGLAPTSTHNIDARSKGDGDAPSRVIAEWLTNKPSPRTGDPSSQAPAGVADAVKQAQRNAEQAVQERTVPARLTPLVRRFFDRLPAAVGAQPAGPAAPSPVESAPVPSPSPPPAKP